jgi:hypothetical protein
MCAICDGLLWIGGVGALMCVSRPGLKTPAIPGLIAIRIPVQALHLQFWMFTDLMLEK